MGGGVLTKQKYKEVIEVGAFAITKDDKLWLCYRKSAQKIADVDNWLLSLLYNLYHWTGDGDLIESIVNSGGFAGHNIPEIVQDPETSSGRQVT